MLSYLVFAGRAHEEMGGWNDLVADAMSLDEAKHYFDSLKNNEFDWVHIVDTEIGEIVLEGTRRYEPERCMWYPTVWSEPDVTL